MIVLGVFKSDKRKTSIEDQKFWLFYAGPENYLDENGVRSLQGEVFWSCEPETRKGDLILLYRKSINQLSVNTLTRRFKMTKEVAQDIKKGKSEKIFQPFGKRYLIVNADFFGVGHVAVT